MRILINAVSAHMGGSITWLQNLLPILQTLAPEDTFYVYIPKTTLYRLDSYKNILLIPYPFSSTSGYQRFYFDQICIPKIIKQNQIDILFSTSGFGSFQVPCKQAILIRNTIYYDRLFHRIKKGLGYNLIDNTLRRWHSVLSMKRSGAILFPSDAIRNSVSQYINFNGNLIKTIHYGKAIQEPEMNLPIKEQKRQQLKAWQDEGNKILLNISTYAIHKNLETAIEALRILHGRKIKVKLITTTSREMTSDKQEYDRLVEKSREYGLTQHWVELGYVPNNHLGWLYQQADLYIFPSFTESFGHSMVEAMDAGLPVIASDTDVNREICRDAGTYFETFNPSSCALAIEKLLNNRTEYTEKILASQQRAQHFSWQKYGVQLLNMFRSLTT